MKKTTPIIVETVVHFPIEAVWSCFTDPKHIIHWNNASVDWHTPKAENDVRIGGTFLFRMEAKDGSSGFDFNGIYTHVVPYELIEYDIEDGRHVRVEFLDTPDGVLVKETFDPEDKNSKDLQRAGWQAILDNFKKYIENINY